MGPDLISDRAPKPQMPAWRIDKRIGLPLVAALFLQTGAGLMWAGAIGQRVSHLELERDSIQLLLERTVRLEEQLVAMRSSLERIEGLIARQSQEEHNE